MDARDRELRRKAADLARAHERRKYYRTYWKQLPPEVFTEPKDEQIHGLLDLIEHEPAVGGILGINIEEHDTYVAEIKLLIDELYL